jgi:hypothetical protein
MMRMSWPVPLASIVLTLTAPLAAGQQPAAAPAAKFSTDQIEQMVAPIALYPDNLVAAVLMAATYPLEVVEADRWLDQNKDLKGDALDAKLKEEDWDPSIKSIITVPEVVKRMSTNLDWTRDLGDAFLAQKDEVMKAVQTMRKKANDAGNLKDTQQQDVQVQTDQTIVIESTNPEVVYVPEYGTEVYGGGWGYSTPYYPSMYPVGWGLLAFGAGIWAGHALWGNCDWHGGDININNGNFNNFNNRTNNNWQNRNDSKFNHNVDHRKGVGYRDKGTADRFGGGKGQGNRVPGSDRARGRPSQQPAGGNRPGAGGGGNRPGGGDRPGGGAGNRPGGGDRPGGGAGNRPGAGGGGAQRPSQQPSRPSGGFSGSTSPRSDRAASNRGGSSRGYSGGSGSSRGYSGGSRSGGGGGRGGGGGGRGGGGRGGGGGRR